MTRTAKWAASCLATIAVIALASQAHRLHPDYRQMIGDALVLSGFTLVGCAAGVGIRRRLGI